tara:strand:+ start:4472 stop:5020 length:549 start_codon:yes stop_codon:yes gene_type:complete
MKASKKRFKKIGILGGTFDPPHNGHLEISKVAIKKLKLSELIWAVTKKNPLKKDPYFNLKKRLFLSKNMTNRVNKIKVKSYDKLTKSSRTINVIKYMKRNNDLKIYFIMGSDNLLNFHKWSEWRKIANLCKIVVFPRTGYMKKLINCIAVKSLGAEKILFIRSKRINISSSKIRKNYLKYTD